MMLKPFKVKNDDGKTFYRDDAAPPRRAQITSIHGSSTSTAL